jgi:hypothetical protein
LGRESGKQVEEDMLGFGVCGDLVEAAGRTVEDEGTVPPAQTKL